MKRFILTAALITSPAIAQTVDVFVVDERGDGVTQYESDTTIAESEVLITGKRPKGATGVVLEKGKPAKWTDASPQDVNESFRGEGEPFIVVLDDSEMEFDEQEERAASASEPSSDPTAALAAKNGDASDIDFADIKDLLPNADTLRSARIEPRDGSWAINIRDQTLSGCPALMADNMRGQLTALETASGNGIFGPGFTPEQMAPQLEWTQVGANSWFGSLIMGQDQGGVVMQWGLQIVSPTVIHNRQQMNFDMGGFGTCEINTFVEAVWSN